MEIITNAGKAKERYILYGFDLSDAGSIVVGVVGESEMIGDRVGEADITGQFNSVGEGSFDINSLLAAYIPVTLSDIVCNFNRTTSRLFGVQFWKSIGYFVTL